MDDERCSEMPDGLHCDHWYDGEACCACGAPEMSEQEKIEQGMVEGPLPHNGSDKPT